MLPSIMGLLTRKAFFTSRETGMFRWGAVALSSMPVRER